MTSLALVTYIRGVDGTSLRASGSDDVDGAVPSCSRSCQLARAGAAGGLRREVGYRHHRREGRAPSRAWRHPLRDRARIRPRSHWRSDRDPQQVYSGCSAIDGSDYPLLRDALDARLNDAALVYEPIVTALGFGFRCGVPRLLSRERALGLER